MMKTENRHTAKIFSYARNMLKLSQRKMAKQLLINQSSVSRIEKGEFFPSDRLIRQLEIVTEMSLDELINAAFSFYGVDKSDEKRVFAAKPKKTLAEMDGGSLEYLKSKWSVSVVELDRKIWKEKQKLSRRVRKQTIYRAVIRKMQQEISMGEEILAHLMRNNAPQEVVNIQEEVLTAKKVEFTQEENVFVLTDDEIYLQQLKIDDMNCKKELRLDKIKDLERIAA